ncbi:uncharacterized protein LY79DRAFT_44772 [Colletotrichum navitas]|uniref:Uncharacterized protein n=1 Tax=Colletotrichum navitas TaxID=681940 RepID=A0AAD8PND9_9PEZI|nr:uncharacterized protein LY79DRAFT_44772 [Colletotrichum navitas]KAK1572675.1 hypothetical protein LY79DRAFT_44772 [Colletotrichum navitas]
MFPRVLSVPGQECTMDLPFPFPFSFPPQVSFLLFPAAGSPWWYLAHPATFTKYQLKLFVPARSVARNGFSRFLARQFPRMSVVCPRCRIFVIRRQHPCLPPTPRGTLFEMLSLPFCLPRQGNPRQPQPRKRQVRKSSRCCMLRKRSVVGLRLLADTWTGMSLISIGLSLSMPFVSPLPRKVTEMV